MKISLIFLLLIVIVFSSCNKKSSGRIPLTVGSIDSAGVFEDYKLWEPPAEAVFINPNNISDNSRDGTLEHPFISFDEVSWKNNTTYALKRSTILRCGQIRIQADGVTLASYGDGQRPLIWCTDVTNESGNRHAIISDWNGINDITIRDIEVTAPDASSCIRFLSDCQNMNVINCKLHDSDWGLRSIGNNNLYIYNTEVYNISDDGMYIEANNGIEIANCYVYDVNLNWHPPSTPETEAGGDGIQFHNCNNWHLHHNIVDRGNSGNKFCFISNNENQNDGIVEYNILSGPYTNGSCIYFHNGRNIIVRYNYFKAPALSPIFTHSTDILIYGNIFDGLDGPAITTASARFYNNVFYQMPICIQGGNIEAVNNVFDITESSKAFQVDNLSSSNNLFVTGTPTNGSFSGNPEFVNPASGDFHIRENSDCIDKGISLGIPFDMEGNPIPQGANPDIGVFEYSMETED
jgi:hypothetical protein